MELLSDDLMDALSLTRERVGVCVSGPLPDTRTHWRRRRIWIRGAFGRPACTLSPTLSRKLNGRGARRRHFLNQGYLSSAAVGRKASPWLTATHPRRATSRGAW